MSKQERDTLRTRYERNAPPVDVRGDWSMVHTRILARSAGKPRRRRRRALIACAGVAMACVLVLGALLALDHLIRRDVVVVIGDGSTVSTAAETSTTSVPIKVSAGNLSDAWVKLGEVVGFDAKTACADQLEIDYTADGDLERLEITAQTEMGAVIIQSAGRSPWGEFVGLTATVSGAETASEVGQEPRIIFILSALDGVDVRALITKFGSEYPLYRVTSTSHAQMEPKATYLWRLGSSSLSLILPGANLPEDEAYASLAMTAYANETYPQSSTAPLQPIVALQFMLPIVADPQKLPKEATATAGPGSESTAAQETPSPKPTISP